MQDEPWIANAVVRSQLSMAAINFACSHSLPDPAAHALVREVEAIVTERERARSTALVEAARALAENVDALVAGRLDNIGELIHTGECVFVNGPAAEYSDCTCGLQDKVYALPVLTMALEPFMAANLEAEAGG